MSKKYNRKDAMAAYKKSQDTVFEKVNNTLSDVFDVNKNTRMKS